METQLGKDILRKEAWSKVSGAAEYTGDRPPRGSLYAKLLTSPHAHAAIRSVDTVKAAAMPGVKAVLTGEDTEVQCGVLLRDRPLLAKGKVRYFGEPVALVVADSEQNAKAAVAAIRADYQPLPVVNALEEAIKPNAPLLHENLAAYQRTADDIYPVGRSNICHRVKMRKGDMRAGWAASDLTLTRTFHLPQSDHAAMETRGARCRIDPDGGVIITASSQAPFAVKEEISECFNVPEGKVTVRTPFVGGGFGGKAAVFLEPLAYLAAQAVPGRTVILANTREEDMATAPCRIGLMATVKLGVKRDGRITAAQMTYHVDCGAYADIGPRMAEAIAVDCAGPYHIENLKADCCAVYTNHTLVTSFRGFGHVSGAFCLERMMDRAAEALGLDPFAIRHVNALRENDLTPTGARVTRSNTGDVNACLTRLNTLIRWEEGARIEAGNGLIRAKGIACFSKTSKSDTNAHSSALLTFNKDGSVNLNCGVVEIGPGMKTTMAQLLAETLHMSVDRVFVTMDVDTASSPKHWKTVASMTTILAGRAVLSAARDAIDQILRRGAVALRCPPEDLAVAEERVFVRADPTLFVALKDVVHGVKYPNGNTVMGPVIGRGSYVMNHLTTLNRETGAGKAGLSWTVGAQAVEVEYDREQHSFRLLRAATVLDAGTLLNPKTAKGVVMGGMCMGLSLAVGEEFPYDEKGIPQNTSFRTYKSLRYGENPDYLIDFVETPQSDTPFGARGIAEHGIIAIPAALANALSLAAGTEINELPVTPETIWEKKGGACP